MADQFGRAAQLPSIPQVSDANLQRVAQSVKEIVEVWQGARGDGLDKVLTVRDLLNAGVLGSDGPTLASVGVSGVDFPTAPTDTAVPPTPTNLVASGAMSTIIVTWDFPIEYTRLAYFEVWRSATDALGSAVLVGQPFGSQYSDDVGPGQAYYYWVRAVSDGGISPYNAVAGTLGKTTIDVPTTLDALTDAALDPASPYTKFAVRADLFYVADDATATDAPVFTVVTSPTTYNGVAVPAGVYMHDAFIMNGSIVNAMIANLAVDSAKIANAAITTAKIANLAVGIAQIADGAITTAKIVNAAITTAKIANLAVGTAQIADAAITNAKINDLAAEKITTGYLNSARIAAGSITASQIGVSSLSAINANLGIVTAGTLRNSTDSFHMNLDATGSALLLRAGAYAYYGPYAGSHYPVEVYADGNAFLGREVVAGGTVKASGGGYAIPIADRPAVCWPTPTGGGYVAGDGP